MHTYTGKSRSALIAKDTDCELHTISFPSTCSLYVQMIQLLVQLKIS